MNRDEKKELVCAREQAKDMYNKAKIVITGQEENDIEVATFGLGNVFKTGLQLITYLNTERCCAKEMVLLPGQTCPEHRHAPIPEMNYPGKEETFRCRYGMVYIYVEGQVTPNPKCVPPEGDEAYYTVWHEICLLPGKQYTMYPNTKHWFQAGSYGAVISEFSTKSFDEYDEFTDPRIIRTTKED